MTNVGAVLRQYLKALQEVKSLRDKNGFIYFCFGSYSEHDMTCVHYSHTPDEIICQMCRAQVERQSADWIKDFLGVISRSKL